MSARYNATRATLTALCHAIETSQPMSAELARAKLILETDELWETAPVVPVPSTGSTSGEHAFSIRVRPPKQLGDWRVWLVSAAISLLAQYLSSNVQLPRFELPAPPAEPETYEEP